MQFTNENNSQTPVSPEIAEMFDDFVEEARNSYRIPDRAFDSYRVKRGLREADGTGVTAAPDSVYI